MAVAVVQGTAWLGFPCHRTSVWYLALEGSRDEHVQHFRQLGLRPEDELFLFTEASTPFVNLHWFFRTSGESDSLLIQAENDGRLALINRPSRTIVINSSTSVNPCPWRRPCGRASRGAGRISMSVRS